MRRWSARSVSFRWNDDLAALACEMAVLLMTGKAWAGATKHIDTFGMECLTLDVRGRTVDVNKLLPSVARANQVRAGGLQTEGVLDADKIYGRGHRHALLRRCLHSRGAMFWRRGGWPRSDKGTWLLHLAVRR